MKPNFRYFKCALSVEPIKSLDEKWRKIERSEIKNLMLFLTLSHFMKDGEGAKVVYGVLFVV